MERETGIDGGLQGWAGETAGRAAGVTGDSLLLGKRYHWGPGKSAAGGVRLKRMDGENTDANKHYSAVHSQPAVGELGEHSSALDSEVELRPPGLDTTEQSQGWVEGPALVGGQWA